MRKEDPLNQSMEGLIRLREIAEKIEKRRTPFPKNEAMSVSLMRDPLDKEKNLAFIKVNAIDLIFTKENLYPDAKNHEKCVPLIDFAKKNPEDFAILAKTAEEAFAKASLQEKENFEEATVLASGKLNEFRERMEKKNSPKTSGENKP